MPKTDLWFCYITLSMSFSNDTVFMQIYFLYILVNFSHILYFVYLQN